MGKDTSPPATTYWSSRWMFILATAGAAIGLGNIWKFPYMVGEGGGSAFVFIYLLCILIIGIPMMICEIILGKIGRQNPIDTMRSLATQHHHSPLWAWVGGWGLLCLLLILSYYSMAAGWIMAYGSKALTQVFTHETGGSANHAFTDFLSHPLPLIFWHTLFMIITVTIVALGVRQGLERAARTLMPLLFILLIFIVIFAAINGNFTQALHYLFTPNFQQITPPVVIAAMGQSFFTLAVGAGAVLMYGAYAPRSLPVINSAFIIAALDTLVALAAGLAIFPLVFAYELEPTAGPGLMFVVLPQAFMAMPFGSLIGAMFFGFLFIAAWVSSINLMEPLVAFGCRYFHCSRHIMAAIIGCIAWLLGLISIFSFNIWEEYQLFGAWTFFDVISQITERIMLPIGGLLFAIFVGWFLPKKHLFACMNSNNKLLLTLWWFLVRFISPSLVLLIVLSWIFLGWE